MSETTSKMEITKKGLLIFLKNFCWCFKFQTFRIKSDKDFYKLIAIFSFFQVFLAKKDHRCRRCEGSLFACSLFHLKQNFKFN